jgi:Isoprenylcysteine carboxyl methyltransferase (ICMT) family
MRGMATAWKHRDKYSSVEATLKRLYFLGVLAQVLIRIPHERRRRKTQMVVEHVDALERALVGMLFVGVLFVPAVYASTSWLDWADYRLPPQAQRSAGGVGAALMTFAVWLFWRSHADLGRNWSPSLQLREGHELVTEGVYRYVRHPRVLTAANARPIASTRASLVRAPIFLRMCLIFERASSMGFRSGE